MVFLFMAVKLDVLSKCCLPFEVIKQPMLLNWSKKNDGFIGSKQSVQTQ